MKAAIQVADKQEAERIRQGLEDPALRALVNVMGALQPLSDADRQRVMGWVGAKLTEQPT